MTIQQAIATLREHLAGVDLPPNERKMAQEAFDVLRQPPTDLGLRPCKGAIALCSRGQIGIIDADEPKPVRYSDGSTGEAWTGIHLSADLLGKPWSSRIPRVVGHIQQPNCISLERVMGVIEEIWNPEKEHAGQSNGWKLGYCRALHKLKARIQQLGKEEVIK